MLLARIQRDLFDFTGSESTEDFGPLLNFWYRANTPALSAALTAPQGLTIIVDASSASSFEHLLKRLFLLADTIVLRDLRGQVAEEEAVRDYLIPDSGHRPPVHALPEPAFLDELRRLNGTPQEVLENEELMQIMSPLLRADFAVSETYTYTSEPPLGCAISVFGGLQDEETSQAELKAWREQTSAAFSLSLFPGDHFFLRTAQPLLLRVLTQELNQLGRMVM